MAESKIRMKDTEASSPQTSTLCSRFKFFPDRGQVSNAITVILKKASKNANSPQQKQTLKTNLHVKDTKPQPMFPSHLFFITQSNTKTGLKQGTFFGKFYFLFFPVCVQGAILDSTEVLKIITFGAILSAAFPQNVFFLTGPGWVSLSVIFFL